MDVKLRQKLNSLTALQLAEVRAFVSSRLQHGIAKAGRKNEATMQICMETLCAVAVSRGAGGTAWVSLVSDPRIYPAFKNKFEVDGLGDWLTSVAKTKVELIAFVRLGCNLLAEELERESYTVTAKLLMRHFYRIPYVINRAFPGYAIGGHLQLVLRKENDDVRQERSDQEVSRRSRETVGKRDMVHDAGRGPGRR